MIREVRDIVGGTIPILLVGSKSDLERKISKERALELQEKIKAAKYVEYSHKDWDSIKEVEREAVTLAASALTESDDDVDDGPPRKESGSDLQERKRRSTAGQPTVSSNVGCAQCCVII